MFKSSTTARVATTKTESHLNQGFFFGNIDSAFH